MGRKSEHTPEERVEIVLRLLRREEPASVLAKRYGVSENTLYRWRDDFIAGGKAQMASSRKARKHEERKLKKLERGIAKRDQVIGELTIANKILKKMQDPSSPLYSEDE
jgi:transposase